MSEAPPVGFWQRLGQIPRAYIYLLLAAVVVWQLLWPVRFPIGGSTPTAGVLEAIRAVPDDKLIVISADWDSSTGAETGPQTSAIMRAILAEKKRFAIINLAAPPGVKLANDRAEAVAKEFGAKYGVDWCNWGYKYGGSLIVIGLAKNIPATIKTDFNGKPIQDLPMMAKVKDVHDLGLVIEVSGAAVTEYWLQYLQGPHGTPLANAVTAVMAPGYYPYLDSKQLQGMLVGVKGAAELETLLRHPGQGHAIMAAQSWAHVLILLLIILGNVGYLLSRKRERP